MHSQKQQEAHQLLGQEKCSTTKIWLQAVRGSIFGRFLNFDKCRPEGSWWRHIWCDCQPGWHGCPRKMWWVYVKQVELFDSLLVGIVLCTYMQYSVTVCSRLEADSQFMSGSNMSLNVPDKCVLFRDPRLNGSGEIRPKAARGCIFSWTSINADRK